MKTSHELLTEFGYNMTNKYIPGHMGSSLHHIAYMQYRINILIDYPFV